MSDRDDLSRVELGFGLGSGFVRVRLGLWLGSGFGLDLRSWLLTHSWRSEAINFLLAYCQIADLMLSPLSINLDHG